MPQSALTLARQVNNNIELQEQNKVLSAELVALRESMSKLQIAYATPHSRPPIQFPQIRGAPATPN